MFKKKKKISTGSRKAGKDEKAALYSPLLVQQNNWRSTGCPAQNHSISFVVSLFSLSH